MILILHIIIALISVSAATLLLLKPTKKIIYGSYGLIMATLASGTYLVVSLNASVLRACMVGLIYLAFTFAITALAHKKAILVTDYK